MSTISFEHDNEIVICRFSDALTHDALLDLAKCIQEYAVANRKWRILLDVRTGQGELSVASRFMLGTDMANFWDRRIRIAVVCRPDQALKDHFWETVVKNKNIDAKIFPGDETLQDARAWLISMPESGV